MEVFPDHSNNELQVLNSCRLYLRCTLIIDLTNIAGNKIRENAWTDKRAEPVRTNEVWPQQQCPLPSAWALWRKALTKYLDLVKRCILSSLGRWMEVQRTQTYQNVWIPEDRTIYCQRDFGIKCYEQIGGVLSRAFQLVKISQSLPDKPHIPIE